MPTCRAALPPLVQLALPFRFFPALSGSRPFAGDFSMRLFFISHANSERTLRSRSLIVRVQARDRDVGCLREDLTQRLTGEAFGRVRRDLRERLVSTPEGRRC